jgi:hypothetical protein
VTTVLLPSLSLSTSRVRSPRRKMDDVVSFNAIPLPPATASSRSAYERTVREDASRNDWDTSSAPRSGGKRIDLLFVTSSPPGRHVPK